MVETRDIILTIFIWRRRRHKTVLQKTNILSHIPPITKMAFHNYLKFTFSRNETINLFYIIFRNRVSRTSSNKGPLLSVHLPKRFRTAIYNLFHTGHSQVWILRRTLSEDCVSAVIGNFLCTNIAICHSPVRNLHLMWFSL